MDKETLKYRIEYALDHIHKYDIEVEHIIWSNGEIAVRSKRTDELICFYAGTGTVRNYDIKGIHNLIQSIESRCI